MAVLFIRLLTALAFVSTPTGQGVPQQSRTRSLTYDPVHKTWVEQPPPPAGTPEGDLHHIRTLNRDRKFRDALRSVKKFIKKHGEEDANYPAVLVAKADALIGRHDCFKAYKVLQSFLDQFSGMALTDEALRLEFEIAEYYLSGLKRKIWGLRLFSGTDTAYRILDDISTGFPDSELAVLAIKTKADHLFRRGDHVLAELEYSRLMRDYPQSRYHRMAMLKTGESALASFRGVDYDDAGLIEAKERFDEYLARWPGAADRERIQLLLDTIQQRRAQKEYVTGAYYERTEHLNSAIYYYRSVVANWPDTIAANRASRRLDLMGASKPAASPEPVSGVNEG